MRLELDAEPIHVRAQSALFSLRPDGRINARGSLLDLRTRGFLPVGGSMQGMGIIHQMELRWVVDPDTRVLLEIEPGQPVVAFEATPETAGESCRDQAQRVRELAGVTLGDGFTRTMRERTGGALGCSHLGTLASFLEAALHATLDGERHGFTTDSTTSREPPVVAPRTLFRRDVVFDAHERPDGRVVVAIRQGDLRWNDAPAGVLAPERFAAHRELAAQAEVDLWPGSLLAIRGAERHRTAECFGSSDAAWREPSDALGLLVGLGLARGATSEIVRRLGDAPERRPWIDALVMLAPALVQCRAAHPDSWHERVRATPRHPGLTAIPDSCWMWRRGGALERIRAELGAVKGGRS